MVEKQLPKAQNDFQIARIPFSMIPGLPHIRPINKLYQSLREFDRYKQEHIEFDNISHALLYGALAGIVTKLTINELEFNFAISKLIPSYISQTLPYWTGLITAMCLPDKNTITRDYDKPLY